jgi:hypothetical protein
MLNPHAEVRAYGRSFFHTRMLSMHAQEQGEKLLEINAPLSGQHGPPALRRGRDSEFIIKVSPQSRAIKYDMALGGSSQ